MSFKKKFIFTLILMTLFFAMIEGVAFVGVKIVGTAAEQRNVYHPLRFQAQKANHYIRPDWVALRTNEDGYIITPDTPTNPDITIVLTGSSSARSQQPFTGADKTVAALLQKHLSDELGISVSVVNTATAGHQAFREFMTLYEYFEHYEHKADMVLSLNGLYSIHNFSKNLGRYINDEGIYPIYDTTILHEIHGIFDGTFAAMNTVFGKFLMNSNLNIAKFINKIIVDSKDEKEKAYKKGLEKDIPENFAENSDVDALYQKLLRRETAIYDMMETLSSSHGASYSFVLLPARYSWSNLPDEMANKRFPRFEHFRQKFYKDILAETQAYPVYNFANIFDGLTIENSPYTDRQITHYNDIGTAYLVEELAKILKPDLQRIARQKTEQ